MRVDLGNAWDAVKDGTKEIAEVAQTKTSEFHENYVSKLLPDCGKYGDTAKFVAEMVPGVSEYNAIVEGDWTAFAIAAGIDIAAIAAGAVTAGFGYTALKGGGSVAKAGVKAAIRETANAGVKKLAKETVETGAKKLAKETVEIGIEKVAKETVETGMEKVVKETVETGMEKVVKETVETGAEKVVKETVEASSEKVVKEFAEESAEKIAEEGTEKVTKELVEKTGGCYADVKKISEGTIHEVHHIPADSATKFDYKDGPAIRMDKMDHRETASWGNSKEAREYCKLQEKLVSEGKIREAIQMDIDDITLKFGNKYDDSIKEMLEYCVEGGII